MGTGLVILTMYSLLFALLNWLGAPPGVFVTIVVFLSAIGFAQMALFRGRKPREASLLAGGVLAPLFYHGLLWGILATASGPEWDSIPVVGFVVIVALTPYAIIAGIVLGYITGCATAGVFLFLGRLARRQAEARRLQAAGPQSPWDEPTDNEPSVEETLAEEASDTAKLKVKKKRKK